jgi:uncharacterized protein
MPEQMLTAIDEPGSHVLISGASGLIGRAVVEALTGVGYRVTRLVRGSPRDGEVRWDPQSDHLDLSRLIPINAVVHLAGENVGARWTDDRRRRIRESRVRGTRLLSSAIAALRPTPRVLVSASAVGIYGDRGAELLTEQSTLGDPSRDFLVSVCLEWEAAADAAREAGIRVVHPRFGVVLSRSGGALKRMLPVFRLGLGGRMGQGGQWMSWISLADASGVVARALNDASLEGPVNATAPTPVTNAEFTRALGAALHRPTPFPVPAAALRLTFGAMAEGTILSSSRVVPSRLMEIGHHFRHRDLASALPDVLGLPK